MYINVKTYMEELSKILDDSENKELRPADFIKIVVKSYGFVDRIPGKSLNKLATDIKDSNEELPQVIKETINLTMLSCLIKFVKSNSTDTTGSELKNVKNKFLECWKKIISDLDLSEG